MKFRKSKFNYVFLSLYIFFSVSSSDLEAQVNEPRDMMWLAGAGPLSNSWLMTRSTIENHPYAYDYNHVVNSDFYDPELGVLMAKDLLLQNITSKPVDDLLCVSHDYGGIIARYTQLETDQISAMVFVGVPHQGSRFVRENLRSSGQNTPGDIIDNALRIVGEDNCQQCGIIDALKDWISDIQQASNYLEDIEYENSIIENINITPPTVPYINIMGDVNPKSTTSFLKMMDSKASLAFEQDILVSCYLDKRKEARKDLEIAKQTHVMKNWGGIVRQVISGIQSIIALGGGDDDGGGGSPIDYIGAIIDIANNYVTSRIERINEANEIQKETARILRCDLATQMIAVQLSTFIGSSGGDFEEVEVEVVGELYHECLVECGVDMAWGDWNFMMSCEDYCSQYYDPSGIVTETRIIYEFSGHDWVYSLLEQSLDSDEKVADIVINANHFQETGPTFIAPVMEDIFNGVHGAAFEVPKK